MEIDKLQDMSTQHRTNAALANCQPFHSSTRTSISTNVSPETKAREQVLMTSELQMTWNAGELQIRCRASRVVMDGKRAERTTRRPYRA